MRAVVLSSKKIDAYDKILTVLSEDLGIIHIYAKGAANLRSRNSGLCQPFLYIDLTLEHFLDKLYLKEGEILEGFLGIRQDVTRLIYASYFADILKRVVNYGENAQDYMVLLLNVFHFLSEGIIEPENLRLLFELQTLKQSGFAPLLDCCIHCGTKDSLIGVDVNEGGAICHECNGECEHVEWDLLDVLTCLLSDDLKFVFNLSKQLYNVDKLQDIASKFFKLHFNVELAALN